MFTLSPPASCLKVALRSSEHLLTTGLPGEGKASLPPCLCVPVGYEQQASPSGCDRLSWQASVLCAWLGGGLGSDRISNFLLFHPPLSHTQLFIPHPHANPGPPPLCHWSPLPPHNLRITIQLCCILYMELVLFFIADLAAGWLMTLYSRGKLYTDSPVQVH